MNDKTQFYHHICSASAVRASFQFSRGKSLPTLNCRSSQITIPNANKNVSIDTNTRKIYAKFSFFGFKATEKFIYMTVLRRVV